MKKLMLIIAVLAALMFSATSAFAAATGMVDGVNLLTPVQRQEVRTALLQVEKKYGVRCAVMTLKSLPDGYTETGKLANDVLDKYYSDAPNGGILLVHVVNSRKWYISTDKKVKDNVVKGDPGVEYMSKEFVPFLKKNDYAGAYKTFAAKADELFAYAQKEGKPWDPSSEFSMEGLIAALIGGLGLGYGGRMILHDSMRNVVEASSAGAYLEEGSLKLHEQEDTFVNQFVSAVPRVKNSGSSSGSDGAVTERSSDDRHGGGGGGY